MEKLIEKWKHTAHTYEVAEKNGKREATRLIGRYKKEAILHCIDELERVMADSSNEIAALHLHNVSGSFSLDFIKWYSGMEEQKILDAFERYKRESGNDR